MHAPAAMDVVAIIGIATAFFAATIGLAQNDIKKVFAYSTVSQLGYMFLGVGMRRVFRRHLSPDDARVLQGAALPRRGQRDPRALRRAGHAQHGRPAQARFPWTFWTMMCAAVAIAGVPPFSGFFSKDAILVAAYHHAPWMYWVGVVTAGMTAFYVFRAMFMTFFGDYRGHEHPHESPPVMMVPLAVLAVLSLVGGFINIPEFLDKILPDAEVPEDIYADGDLGGLRPHRHRPRLRACTSPNPAWPIPSPPASGGLYTLVYNKYFVDEIYDAAVVKPLVERIARGALEGRRRRADRRHGERRRLVARRTSAACCG